MQKFLESLTATYAQPKFNEAATRNGFKIYSEPRGAPENVGEVLEAVHPVIRTKYVFSDQFLHSDIAQAKW